MALAIPLNSSSATASATAEDDTYMDELDEKDGKQDISQRIIQAIASDVPSPKEYLDSIKLKRGALSDELSVGTVDRIGTHYRRSQDTITKDQEDRLDWHESLYRLNCEYNEKHRVYFAVPTRLPRRVMVSMNLKRVGDIDMRGESFRTLYHVYLNWLPTREEYRDMLQYYWPIKTNHELIKWLVQKNEQAVEKEETWADLRRNENIDKYPDKFLQALVEANIDAWILNETLPEWEKIDELLLATSLCPDKQDEGTDALIPDEHPFKGNWDGFWNMLLEDKEEEVRKMEHWRLDNGGPWKPDFVPRMEPRNTVEIHFIENEKYPLYGEFKITKFKKFSKGLSDRSFVDVKALKRSFWIRQKVNFDVTFSEELELDSFPFDYQDLTIPMRENSNASKCVLTPELRDGRFFACDPTGFALQEYRLVAIHLEILKMPATRGDIGYSGLIIRCKMRRNWRYYVWRVVVQMMLITGLSLCAFTLDASLKAERLAYLVTLLLTAVAFQTVIQDELPNTPYMTRMDEYILICFMFMTFITVWTAFVFRDGSRIERADTLVFYLSSGMFVLYHLVYFVIIFFLDSQTELEKIDKNPLLEQREKQLYFHRKPVRFKSDDPIERLSTDAKKEWFRYCGRFDDEEDIVHSCSPMYWWQTVRDCFSGPFRADAKIDDLPPDRDFCQCKTCKRREANQRVAHLKKTE